MNILSKKTEKNIMLLPYQLEGCISAANAYAQTKHPSTNRMECSNLL